MSERMIEQRRAMLLAQTSTTAASPQNGVAGSATPRQAAAQAMRSEDNQLSRFLRLLQETRDDGQAGEVVFGPTVPTALSRREIHRQGVGFADTAVAAVVSAAADRFLASVLQQSIPCRDQRLKGIEVARHAAHKRKRFRQNCEQDLADRRRRNVQEATKRDNANRAAIRMADEMETKPTTNATNNTNTSNTGKRKTPDEDDDDEEEDLNNNKVKKAKPSNGMIQAKTEVPDIDYDSIDEENKMYIDHYEDYNQDEDLKSDDEDDEDKPLILSDLSRPLRAWGFNVDGKLLSDIFASVVENVSVFDDTETDLGAAPAAVEESSNGHMLEINGDAPPNREETETGGNGKPSTVNAAITSMESPKKVTPKSGDGVNTTAKSPSTS